MVGWIVARGRFARVTHQSQLKQPPNMRLDVTKAKPFIVLTVLFAAMLSHPALAQTETKDVYPGPIDVNKMDPALRAVGPYSFYVPPYNLYYFHHIDQLNVQQDWIHRSGPVFAL